jgi:hypothetical protein
MTNRVQLGSVLRWLDDHILLILAGFLLAFVPLYPKIPFWSPIEQYIVRVRLEDIFILLAAGIWVIQVLRKKVQWRSHMFWWILAYGVVAALSTLVALFVTKTIPIQPLHVGKTLLHNFRYLEYFSLFFIFYSAIKSRKDVFLLLGIFMFSVVAMSVYGFGQKYYYWPVYSTMNREFSKGIRLVLTPHARVQSTFAGHYDMAAYLVIALPLILALAYYTKNRKWSTILHITFWVGTWLIIVSASRTSFIAYLFATFLVLGFTALQRNGIWPKIRFVVSRGLLIFICSSVLFLYFGEDLADRMSQVIDSNKQVHDAFHGLNKQRKEFWNKYVLHQTTIALPILPPAEVPKNAITTEEAIELGVLSPTDERPVAATRPADVYVDVPDIQKVSTTSADGTVTTVEVNKGPRIYSDNALKYGLSMAIRLDTLWPNAIKGFRSNPLLGKGYATLNKEAVTHFTEAESTDNNFLRTLGETGALGFLTFYGAVAVVLFTAVQTYRRGDRLAKALSIGMFSATLGLLFNALYIDVFASSKVAETYWSLAGIFLSYVYLWRHEQRMLAIPEKDLPAVITETPEIPLEVPKKKKVSKKKAV